MSTEALFGEGGKRLYIVGRAITVVVGLIAGAFSLAIGGHNYLRNVADRGPAIVLTSISIGTLHPGEMAQILLSFDKKRHCQPATATFEIVDKNGVVYPAEIQWHAPYPVGDGIKGRLKFMVPENLPMGKTKESLVQIYHDQCTDGADPQTPATFSVPPLEVRRN